MSVEALQSLLETYNRKIDENEKKVLSFSDVADALRDIKEQFLAGSTPLVWRGIDNLHHSISASSPEPSWHFSNEGLAYHAERDRDFWDVYLMVTYQIGFHNGTINEHTKVLTAEKYHYIEKLYSDVISDKKT